ncbi:MAG: hypothetical protein M0Z85_03115 [Gammaproteobacteria bacterium]|nr:hypothetical protein [Gammaproteobacteria bacterium]
MPRKPTRKTGPMAGAERMREKRARDREIVWGCGDEKALSDSGLIEQLRHAFAKDRQAVRDGQRNRSTGAITRALLKEIGRRV